LPVGFPLAKAGIAIVTIIAAKSAATARTEMMRLTRYLPFRRTTPYCEVAGLKLLWLRVE
jgi:hypothetical protein